MDDQSRSGDLEMRIMELENQLKELRAAQEQMGGQAGAQAASPCVTCYCSPCYCYAAPPPTMMQAAIPCAGGGGAQTFGCIISPCIVSFCIRCYPCINECICGPCNICSGPIGGLGGGGRFGGLGS